MYYIDTPTRTPTLRLFYVLLHPRIAFCNYAAYIFNHMNSVSRTWKINVGLIMESYRDVCKSKNQAKREHVFPKQTNHTRGIEQPCKAFFMESIIINSGTNDLICCQKLTPMKFSKFF